MKKIQLFCVPYAGGTVACYLQWKKYLPDWIEVIPLELSGHGSRIMEPLFDNMQDMVQDVYTNMLAFLDGSNFALFGHSMGSTIIYEIVRKLQKNKALMPVHIFFSARFPPHFSSEIKLCYFDDERFIEEIIKMGGTPKVVFEDEELRKCFLPILQKDYKVLDLYSFQRLEKILDINISIFYGKKDIRCNIDKMKEWKSYTMGRADFFEFNGDHFFLIDKMKEVTYQIEKSLERELEMMKERKRQKDE